MIKYGLTRFLEITINQVLALDLNAHQDLIKYNGKVLKLTISSLQLSLYFLFSNEKVHVQTVYSEKPDTVIKGDIFAFIKYLLPHQGAGDLIIEGDMDFAQDVQKLLQSIDINWEEYFSYFAGDFAANRLSSLLAQVKRSSVTIAKRTVEDTLDYVQEEKKFLPTREEVEDFYEEIALIRLAIDRLEARCNRLKEKRSS